MPCPWAAHAGEPSQSDVWFLFDYGLRAHRDPTKPVSTYFRLLSEAPTSANSADFHGVLVEWLKGGWFGHWHHLALLTR